MFIVNACALLKTVVDMIICAITFTALPDIIKAHCPSNRLISKTKCALLLNPSYRPCAMHFTLYAKKGNFSVRNKNYNSGVNLLLYLFTQAKCYSRRTKCNSV